MNLHPFIVILVSITCIILLFTKNFQLLLKQQHPVISFNYSSISYQDDNTITDIPILSTESTEEKHVYPSQSEIPQRKMFSVIIVTHNEKLLEKT